MFRFSWDVVSTCSSSCSKNCPSFYYLSRNLEEISACIEWKKQNKLRSSTTVCFRIWDVKCFSKHAGSMWLAFLPAEPYMYRNKTMCKIRFFLTQPEHLKALLFSLHLYFYLILGWKHLFSLFFCIFQRLNWEFGEHFP